MPQVADPLETLMYAWTVALAVDQGLAAERFDVGASRASLRAAQSQRWPNVVGESSYTVRDNERAFRFPNLGGAMPLRTVPFAQDEGLGFRTGINLPLYTSGRIQHGVAAARAGLSAAQQNVAVAQSDLKLIVAEEYVDVLRAQRGVGLAESHVKSLDAHARDVDKLFAHQQVPRNDLLAAQVELSNAQQRSIQAYNALDAARAAYNRRLGRSLVAEVRIAELPVEPIARDLDMFTARALRNRPEPARLAAQIGQLRHQAESLRGKDGPQMELLAEYAFEENRFQTPEGITSVGVAASWNLFDAGRIRHRVTALRQQAEAMARRKAELESIIALQVRRAWLDVEETRQRIEVTRRALEQADENFRVASNRYTAGVGTNTEVLDAETLRTKTYHNHDNATYDAVLATIRLHHAAGEL